MTDVLKNSQLVLPRLAAHGGPIVALIPAHNEERFIGSLVLTVLNYVDQVVVVDDGSADRTAEVARKAGATVIQHPVNLGKAAAVNTGFACVRRLKPAALVMLDGDGQHCSDDIPLVLAPLDEQNADVVVGSRFLSVKSDIPVYRQVGQHGLTMVTNLASGVRLSDSQSGFRAFSARALEQLFFSQGGFAVESEMQFLIREHKLKLVEVPIKVIYAERAKRSPLSHGMQVINGVMRLVGQRRPLLYFGLSGLVLFALGAALGLHVINIYAHTQQLAVGYGLITVMLGVLGMVLLGIGVILHSTRAMILDLRHTMLSHLRDERER